MEIPTPPCFDACFKCGDVSLNIVRRDPEGRGPAMVLPISGTILHQTVGGSLGCRVGRVVGGVRGVPGEGREVGEVRRGGVGREGRGGGGGGERA